MYKSQARYPGAGKSDRDKELRFGQAIITNTGERDGRLKGKNKDEWETMRRRELDVYGGSCSKDLTPAMAVVHGAIHGQACVRACVNVLQIGRAHV